LNPLRAPCRQYVKPWSPSFAAFRRRRATARQPQVNRVKQWTRPDVAVIAGSNATRQSPAVAEGQRSALSPRAAYNRMLGGQTCMIADRSA
jgi:hypothetical protein